MKILSHRSVEVLTHRQQSFSFVASPGSGFGFECDEAGNILPLTNDCAKANLAGCLAGIIDGKAVKADGMVSWERQVVHPRIGECNDCGAGVALDGFTNTCVCGADYNMSGQQLASRDQWGEETGERLSDILNIA